MSRLLILAGYLAIFLVAWRHYAYSFCRSSRQESPRAYDDSSYDRRNSPHGFDVTFGAMLGLMWPITGWFILYEMTGSRRRRRWERQRDRRVSLKTENENLKAIIAELERETTS